MFTSTFIDHIHMHNHMLNFHMEVCMMQNNEFSLQFSKIEQLLRRIYNQQDIMLQYLAGKQPAVNLENRTSTQALHRAQKRSLSR